MEKEIVLLLCDNCVELFKGGFHLEVDQGNFTDKCVNCSRRTIVHRCHLGQSKRERKE